MRILREAGLTLPVDYVRERRDLAGARREAFVELPTRRNRVWQMDFFELETSVGGTWRSGDVIDYATKPVLAGPVTATQTTRDAIDSVQRALEHAAQLLDRPLIDDLTDSATGQVTPILLVPDNGPCFKSAGFARYIDSRPELRHIRTRRRSPQTNGVIERYHGAIKIEALWRELPADGAEMTTMVEATARSTTTSARTRRSPATARSSATSPPPTTARPTTSSHSPNAQRCADSLRRDKLLRAVESSGAVVHSLDHVVVGDRIVEMVTRSR